MNEYIFNIKISELAQSMNKVSSEIDSLKRLVKPDNELWDNSDMIRHWKISERTLATWRSNGWIEYVQVGHKIFYTQENRINFLNRFKEGGLND